ncbi:hypothetical protein FOCC_FOCC017839 [Frankliniella occidentalis]|nr:hypothetical protein FOCC_FOCC017839 [Frankliniella occidentalis]
MLPSFGPPCIVGRYRLLGKVLGKGNYARVEEAVHLDLEPSEAHVAIKMIDTHTVRDPYVLRNLEREAEVLRLLRHPNIIAIFEVLKAGRYHCIVTELVGGGELCAYGLLTANPSRRLSLQEAVEHPWVGNRLRARQLLNIQYKLSGQERALILTKLAVMLNSTVQSIDAQCRQKDLGEVSGPNDSQGALLV